MSEIKIFRVTGHYMRRRRKFTFSKDVRALKSEHALEQAISEVTSRGIFRRQIVIEEVKEIQSTETQSYVIRYLEDLQ